MDPTPIQCPNSACWTVFLDITNYQVYRKHYMKYVPVHRRTDVHLTLANNVFPAVGTEYKLIAYVFSLTIIP